MKCYYWGLSPALARLMRLLCVSLIVSRVQYVCVCVLNFFDCTCALVGGIVPAAKYADCRLWECFANRRPADDCYVYRGSRGGFLMKSEG